MEIGTFRLYVDVRDALRLVLTGYETDSALKSMVNHALTSGSTCPIRACNSVYMRLPLSVLPCDCIACYPALPCAGLYGGSRTL